MIKLKCDLSPQENNLKRAQKGWQQLLDRKDIGFFDLPRRMPIWSESEDQGKLLAKNYDCLCVLGMGGSALGGLALYDGLVQPKADKRLIFFDNIDARSFWEKVRHIENLKRTHWLIISKSGTTMETLAMAEFAEQHLQENGLSLAGHSTVVASFRPNPLGDWARRNGVRVLEIPEDVGGRFSVFTPVGLVPAAFCGINLEELRKGALWALESRELVCSWAARVLDSFSREEWITIFFIYSERLRMFGAWFQQLWGESLGKKLNLKGQPAPRVSSPFYCVGASDQHSILQQFMEGAKDKFIWFITDSEAESYGPLLAKNLFPSMKMLSGKSLGRLLEAEARATQQALGQEGVSTLRLEVEQVSAQTMGALLMSSELLVAIIGEALGINTFDQPGVEAGKILARTYLQT